MVLTAYFALSLVTGLVCHHRFADFQRVWPGWAALASAKLDASVGASGPHDFAVRARLSKKPLDGLGTRPVEALAKADQRRSSARCKSLTSPKAHPATTLRADAAASTASRPAFVTIASRPSVGRDGRVCRDDLPDGESAIFFVEGLDFDWLICRTGWRFARRADCDERPLVVPSDSFPAAIHDYRLQRRQVMQLLLRPVTACRSAIMP
jgi:hypothetical protein